MIELIKFMAIFMSVLLIFFMGVFSTFIVIMLAEFGDTNE